LHLAVAFQSLGQVDFPAHLYSFLVN
jgi:hypothetical protein